MSVKFKRLLVAGPPNSDESFIGYIVRITEWNKYDRVSWILSRIGFGNSANYGCPLVFNKSTDLSPLAKLTGVSVSRLKPLLYPPAVPETGSRQLIFGLPVSRYMIQVKRTKLCPDCLRESNYHRKIWDLAPVTACPIHKCLLIDSCSQCSNAITWNRNALSVCECGHDWRKSTSRLVKESGLGLVQHIYHLCGYKIIGYQSNDTPRFNPLFSLTLEDFLSAIVFLAGQYCGVLSTAGKHLLPSRNNEELHGLLTLGFSAFDNWPQGYYEFLDWKRGNRQADVSGTGVKKDFGDFHHALRVVLTTSSFDFMRTVYGEYLNSMWDGGSLNTKTLRLVTIKPQEKRLLTKNEVIQLFGLTEDWINRLLRQDELRPKVIHRQKVKLTLFARKEVESAKRYVEQLLSTNEVASLLHVGRVKVVDLVKEGCLTPAYGPVADGSKHWKFEKNEVEELNRKIEGEIVAPPSGAHTFISLRTVTRIAGHARVGIGRIIKAVLTGEIHPCGKRDKQGLDRFIFSEEQISEYLEGLRQEFIGEAISLDEATTLIGVKKDQLYAFINHGLLVGHKSFTGRAETWVTTLEDVAFFNSSYLIASHVLEELGTSSELLVSALKDKGVHPVLGHKVKKELSTFLERRIYKTLTC